MKNIILAAFFSLAANNALSQTTLLPFGSSWRYLDNGSNQGTGWRSLTFNDGSWRTGNAELGYGDGDEATRVRYGSFSSYKYVTTYFRKAITISNPAQYSGFTLSIKRDDGAIVYVNGTERFRTNMPSGTVSYTTLASSDASDDGKTAQTVSLTPAMFIAGNNVIAVEVHQRSRSNSDLSFDLQLTATTTTTDVTAPVISSLSPADNASNIAANANLVLAFNEPVQKGTGNIIVKESGVVTQTISVAAASVVVSGNTITIDPANFGNNAAVNIEMAAGVFKDLASNNHAGITSATAWNFNVVNADLNPPVVTSYSPADNATGVAVEANLQLIFNEPVLKGSGNIMIKEAGVVKQTIAVTATAVSVSGNTVTINPSDLSYSSAVNIEMAAGTFRDNANNNFAGITSTTAWNFTTVAAPPPGGPQTLVAFGSSWKYLDNGSNQGTAWRAASFNDAGWSSGNAQFGYGDGDETTVVSYGTNASSKFITTYFRKTITVTNPSSFASIAGSVKRDDGVAIYVNGTEVYRNNLAAAATYTTLATLASDDGATSQTFSFSPSVLIDGDNVIAVELHQNAANSTDISFDLQLVSTVPGAVTLTRGPYLNMGNETAVTLRWRTDVASNSKVEIGSSLGTYPVVVNDAANVTEHEVRITGLLPDTKYYYRFGSSTTTLQQGADNFFRTAPTSSTTRKIRIAAFGDCGRNDNLYQSGTLTSYQNYTGSNPAEVMLLLGDNAYNNGTDAEFQNNFFNVYSPNILKNHVLFPSPGNHDYAGSASRQADHNIPYYSIFTNPTAAECGGVASGSEAYFSWNWGNVHFISLDSYGKENAGTTRMYDTTGAQAVWVKADLAANTRPWVVAYWHHPPFTKGSHNSDTDIETTNIRQNFIRILERYGVDLIICGHSHDYERSYLLKNYFGTEATFNIASHTLSNSSGKYNGSSNSCPYVTVPGKTSHGTVYVVAGSAGASGGVQSGYPHDALPFAFNDGGMLYLEVEGNRLDAKFIRRTGVIADQFTILKDANKTNSLSVNAGSPVTLTASWNGTYAWNTGTSTRSITVSPVVNTTYTVTDAAGCLTDVFNVSISTGLRTQNSAGEKLGTTGAALRIVPNYVKKGRVINVQALTNKITEAMLVDAKGRMIRAYNFNNSFVIETNALQRGAYFLRYRQKGVLQTQKFVVTD